MKYDFTQDWFSQNIPVWEQVLAPYKDNPCFFLELGVFEGMATCWLLDNILTHEHAHIICVDTWEGSMESMAHGSDTEGSLERFKKNIQYVKQGPKLDAFQRRSTDFLIDYIDSLRRILKSNDISIVDVIYVDASHVASEAMTDILLSWKLLKQDGLLIMDDYDWTFYDDPKFTPKPAIDFFLESFAGRYTLLEKNHQVIVRKDVT